MEERIKHLFGVSIESKMTMADTMAADIAIAARKLVNCLLNDGKIMIAGNGGSAANCLHFSAAMLHHFEVERPPLPVLVLATDYASVSSIASDGHYEQIFARQIQALGHEGDILILLSTSGNASSLIPAVHAANEKGIDTIALNGRDGGVLANHLGPEDIELRVPGDTIAQIRENHLFVLHCFCDLIDQALFGQMLG